MLFSEDTSPEARALLIESYRAMTPQRRFEIALQATEAARAMVRADIAARYPDATPKKRHELFLERWIGPELTREVLAARRDETAGGAEVSQP